MTDKEKKDLVKKAKNFCGSDDAFIHSEMKHGETQQVVCGNLFGIIHGCFVALRRTAELTKMPLNTVLNLLIDDYEHLAHSTFCREPADVDFPNSSEF